jgi:uncharacterized protein (DUF58 family)
VLLDASGSMAFEDKLQRAAQLAAVFGVVGLLGGERVRLHVFSGRDADVATLRVPRGRHGMVPLLRCLEDVEGGGDRPLDEALEVVMRTHRGRGVLVVLSDFLTASQPHRALNTACSRGLELFGVQILGHAELHPEPHSDLRLVDAETGDVLDVTGLGDVLDLYHEHLRRFQSGLAQAFRQRRGRFLTIDSSEPIDVVVLDRLRRQGWLR